MTRLTNWLVSWVRFWYDNHCMRRKGMIRIAPKGVRGRIWAYSDGTPLDPQGGNMIEAPTTIASARISKIRVFRQATRTWEEIEF